jgi:lysophospholipase L1-like esterase
MEGFTDAGKPRSIARAGRSCAGTRMVDLWEKLGAEAFDEKDARRLARRIKKNLVCPGLGPDRLERATMMGGDFYNLRRGAKRLALCLLGMGVALVCGEFVLRGILRDVREYYTWWPHLQRTFRVEPGLMPGVEGVTRFQVSSLGLRADEISTEDSYRMLAVGGSTTECLFLDQDVAWPEGVEHFLNECQSEHRVWMGNAGKSGLNTRDHIVLLRRLLPNLPRIDAVVMMTGVNDMMLCLSRGEAYNPDFILGEGAEELILGRSFQMLPLDYEHRYLAIQQTALWRLASRVKDSLIGSNKTQDNAGAAIRRWREHRRTSPEVLGTLPDIEDGLEEYRRNIRELIRICTDHGARVIFLTQPYIWQEDFPEDLRKIIWLGGIGDYMEAKGCTYYDIGPLREGMERYNRTLLQVCVERGVECFDLASRLPRDMSVFYDDIHFNIGGSKQTSKLVGEYLLSRPPFGL